MISGKTGGGLHAFLHTSFIRKVVGLSLVSTVSALFVAFAVVLWLDWRGDQLDLVRDEIEVGHHLAAVLTKGRGLDEAHAIFRSDEAMAWAVYYPAVGAASVFQRPGSPAALEQPRGVRTVEAAVHGAGAHIHMPVLQEGRRLGELVIEADSDEIRAKLERNIVVTLAASFVATVLAGLLSALLAARTLAPLHALNRAIESVRRTKNFAAAAPVTSEDEIGRLSENFNALLADLDVYSTNLKQALSEVTAARDVAEDATRLKSQFVANMSHEIRTPLNGVLGMAQVMATGPLTSEQHERLEVIRRSGAALLSVLNDVLDLSKIEAGHLEIESEPFDIDEVAGGACAVFTTAANAKGLSFGLHIGEGARGGWRGDSVRVRQLLYNLISNAIKFTETGEVQVTIDRERSDVSDVFVMAVSDTGIGVKPEDLPRLFEKFTQADISTTRRFGGTGLGLTICRHIVDLMGGTIEAVSKVGLGTTFEVRLPMEHLGAAVAASVVAGSTSDEAADLSGLRVLAAEDNETNQLVLKTILHSLGVVPSVVSNGRQAVEALATAEFDLVLMDIQMPVMDGVAATREIRAREAADGRTRTRIVALSANAMRHQVAEYLAAGMDGHLAKPIAIDRLLGVLTEANDASARMIQAA